MSRPTDRKSEPNPRLQALTSELVPGAQRPTAKARVLVVEDDAIVGSDILFTLRRLGYTVIGPYATAADSLTAVPEHKPDIVLMDIQTKGPLDGVEAARILRERMRVPVIFLTAHSDPETVKRASRAQPLGYMIKPFKAADLVSVIEVALNRQAVENAMRDRDHELATLTARLVAAIDSLDGAVMIEDETGQVELINDQLQHLLAEGGCSDVANLRERDQVFAALQQIVKESSRSNMSVSRMLAQGPGKPSALVELVDGRLLELHVARTVVRDAYGGCLWTFRDVTEREETKRALKEMSLVDELTALHNRRGLSMLSSLLIKTALRDKKRVAVYFIDLDNMKPINDRYGHEVGDQMLRRTADVLRCTCRSSDVLSRLGGDEFVVVSALVPPGECQLLARLQDRFAQHNQDHPELPSIQVSIGYALSEPDRPETFEGMLSRADAAMYVEKQRRK